MFSEREVLKTGNDDVIMDMNVEIAQKLFQPARKLPVCTRGIGVASGMIMSQNDGGGVMLDNLFYDQPGKHSRTIHAAFLNSLNVYQQVLAVEREDAEHLTALRPDFRSQQTYRVVRGEDFLLVAPDSTDPFDSVQEGGG